MEGYQDARVNSLDKPVLGRPVISIEIKKRAAGSKTYLELTSNLRRTLFVVCHYVCAICSWFDGIVSYTGWSKTGSRYFKVGLYGCMG